MARIERSSASQVGRTAPLPKISPKVENAIKEIARQTGSLGSDRKAVTAGPSPLDIPGVDIQNVEIPPGQQYVNNGTQSGTSGTGTGRPRRADAGPAPTDFASAGPLPDKKPDLTPETQTLPAPVDFANNGTQATTSGTGATGQPRPRPGAGAKAQAMA